MRRFCQRSFVYLAPALNLELIKIGGAYDIFFRLGQIGIDLFDLHGCIALEVSTRRQASCLERALHSFFKPLWIPTEFIYFGKSGRSEWFRAEVAEHLDAFLETHSLGFVIKRIDNCGALPRSAAHSPGTTARPNRVGPSRSAPDPDASRAVALQGALVKLAELAWHMTVGPSPGKDGDIQVELRAFQRPEFKAQFAEALAKVESAAYCQATRTSLVRNMIVDGATAFLRFGIPFTPPNASNRAFGGAVEVLFREPIAFLRQRAGEHQTDTFAVLRRLGKLPPRGRARARRPILRPHTPSYACMTAAG